MDFSEIVSGLAGLLELRTDLAPDATGAVRIDLPEGQVVLRENGETRQFTLRSDAGPVPESGAGHFKEVLLKGCFLGRYAGGGRLALSQDGRFFLELSIPSDTADADVMARAVRAQAWLAGAWREMAGEYGPVAGRMAKAREEEMRMLRRMVVSNFLRV